MAAIVYAQEDSAQTDCDLYGKKVVSYLQPLMMSRNHKEMVFYGGVKLLNLFIDLHTPNMPQNVTINTSYKDTRS